MPPANCSDSTRAPCSFCAVAGIQRGFCISINPMLPFSTWLASARSALAGRRRSIATLIVLMALLIAAATTAAAWISYDILSDLPSAKELRSLGDMAQATTVYDVHDLPVFTIYKEQRMEVPLARISPNLVKA